MSRKERIVIVGNGMAAGKLSEDNPEIRPVQIFETAVRGGQLNVRVAPPRHPATKE